MKGPLESTKFYILLALSAGPNHGAGIRAQIIGDSLGIYLSDSTLYEALSSMQRTGLVERNVHKEYRLTGKGKQQFEREAQSLHRAARLAERRLNRRFE